MAELVGQHGHHLARAHRLEERVEEDDPLLAEDAGEVGVAVGGAAGGVHDGDPPGAEAGATGQVEDRLLQLPLRERGEPVEDRREDGRVDPGREEAEGGGDAPGPQPPRRAHPLHEPEDRGEDGAAEEGGEGGALQPVEEEAADGLAVEPVLLLDAEGRVEVEGQLEERREEAEHREEGEAGGDRSRAERGRDAAGRRLDGAEAARGQEREAHEHLRPAIDERKAVPVAGVGHGLRHLFLADAEGPARLAEAAGVGGVPPVQAGEGGLDGLLEKAEGEEEGEERGHGVGIMGRLSPVPSPELG